MKSPEEIIIAGRFTELILKNSKLILEIGNGTDEGERFRNVNTVQTDKSVLNGESVISFINDLIKNSSLSPKKRVKYDIFYDYYLRSIPSSIDVHFPKNFKTDYVKFFDAVFNLAGYKSVPPTKSTNPDRTYEVRKELLKKKDSSGK